MQKSIGWICVATLIAYGLWEMQQSSAHLPPSAWGMILLGLGLVCGLRIGSDSATTFVRDLLRLNKFLADQNEELTELNHWHVKYSNSRKSDTGEHVVND
ncbi:MAG: hypothetical protein ABGX16_12780 [Pirellulales bacterium]